MSMHHAGARVVPFLLITFIWLYFTFLADMILRRGESAYPSRVPRFFEPLSNS